MANEGILSKIQGLLSKTVDAGCTVEEAASAAAIAQKLLTEHKLSLADLGGFDEGEAIHNNTSLYSGNRVITWKGELANVICRVNGCRLYYYWENAGYSDCRRKHTVSFKVIGRDSDLEIVSYLFNYLTSEVERLCKAAMGRGEGSGKRWSNSFKLGATRAVCNRLSAASRQARSVSTSTAIVKVDSRDKEVEQWADRNLNLKKSPGTRSTVDAEGYLSGQAAGSRININQGLGGGKKNPALSS